MHVLDALKFIGKYIAHPMQVGAVCPSSRFLARKMAESAGKIGKGDIIVELGAGTGAITSKLQPLADECGAELYCVEFEPTLAKILKERFPNAKVVNDSAENIGRIVGEENFPRIRAIISCLPLVSLPKPCVASIPSASEEVLPEGARFVQFTYSLARSPKSLGFKKMKPESVSFVALNIPPARIDIFTKSGF